VYFNASKFFNKHNGNTTVEVMPMITLDLVEINSGRFNDLASDENESPIIIEYARHAKKVLNVIINEIIDAVLGPTDFDHASANDLVL
jgi:hypothetical protein